MNPITRLCISACVAMFATAASASGGGRPYDRFVNRSAPDFSLARFQAGQLGVLQPGYQRVYLYAAWRAISLSADGLKAAPNPPGGILRANGGAYSGWNDYAQSQSISLAWKEAAAQALKRAHSEPADAVQGWIECPRESYVFATQTVAKLAQRPDATPQRLLAWVEAQDRVFTFCGDDPRPRSPRPAALPALPVPAELPDSEGAWAQLRGYQIAAAHFYKGDLAESALRFSAIGATAGHPMRQWGAYLALRSGMREATRGLQLNHADLTERAAALGAEAQRILDDPSLAALHEPTRAAVRAMLARLAPAARFEQLSSALDNPRANPYLDDHLGDWRVLADRELDLFNPERGARQAQRHQFIDWIVTLQSCGFPDGADCGAQRAHAQAQWETLAAAGDRAGARPWLVAALMLAKTVPAPMEQAALAVPPGAPEYATVRYHLARTYRIAEQAAKVRTIADAMLAMPLGSTGARNLFLQERFAAATSNADAAVFLLRQPVHEIDADTGESAAPEEAAVPGSDGLDWINSSLPVADLLELARNPALGGALRNAIAGMAWIRADLLGQQEAALSAAALLEPASTDFAAAAREYRQGQTAEARRHTLVLAALRLRLTSLLEAYEPHLTGPFVLSAPSETVASNWCGAAGAARVDAQHDPERPPPPPATTNDPARLAREIATLNALPTATGFIGRHVMQRAAAVPADPDLAWLLYVVVQSTRGGCTDPDSHALSKQAFTLLHRRFPDSEWARKTPYFY
jgi:hypothetical protein